MKCLACDVPLTAREATNRSLITGDFLDMCTHCLKEAGITEVAASKNLPKSEIMDSDVSDMEDLLNDALGG